MFRVILCNWLDEKQNLAMQTTDEIIMEIPLTGENKPCMINPIIKEDMGKAPSFDFTVNPGMAYYNAYKALKTIIRIDYNLTANESNWKNLFILTYLRVPFLPTL